MQIVEVIPSRSWFNKNTGLTASLYGACPWTSEAYRANWELRTTGYTWRLSNGTVGLGRRPVATRAEAEEIMKTVNARFARRDQK